MRYFILIFCLAACGPSPTIYGAKQVDLRRDGRDYRVFYTDRRAEVIRLGYAKRGDHQAIRATMIDMIPVVTGCRLLQSTLQGDSGVMRGSIRCS